MSITSRRLIIKSMASAGLGCVSSPAFSQVSTSGGEYVVGMSAPLTGVAGTYGLQMKQGIDVCFEGVNRAGGVHNRRLRLVVLDDGYEPKAAVENTRRLIEQPQFVALTGFYGTASTEAVMPLIEEKNVLLVGAVSGAASLRGLENSNIFHVRASYSDETAAIVKNLAAVGIERIAVFYQNDGFGKSGLDGVRAAAAGYKLQVMAVATVERNSVDVQAAVDAIGRVPAQAVIMVSLHQSSAAFIKRMRAAGLSPFFVGLSPIGTDQLVSLLGPEHSRGIQVSQVIPNPFSGKTEVARDYRAALAAYAGGAKPSYYGLEGYIGARTLLTGLQNAGEKPTTKKIIAGLRSKPIEIGGYRLAYGKAGNQGSNYVEISVIGQNGSILN